MRVIGYVRVSTDGQFGEDKFGVEAQRDMIETYCKEHDMEIVDWKEDLGISGASEYDEEREGFYSIVNEVHNPPIEGVVVAKSDRIARDMNLYFYYKMLLQKKEIELYSVTDETSQFGEFANVIQSFLMFAAEQERKNIARRTLGGRIMKAKSGGYAGGRAPYGYIANHGKLIINPEEAEVVWLIFKLRKQGKSLRQIAKLVNEEYYARNKGDFNAMTISIILKNKKLYQGYYKYASDEWVKGKHEAILKETA